MTFRLTDKRKQILTTLEQHPGALSVAEIHTALPHIDRVTIYRNLELFTKERLIKQLHLGTDESRYEYQSKPHHHAICTDCARIVHFSAPDEKLKKLLKITNFSVTDVEVIVHGSCKH